MVLPSNFPCSMLFFLYKNSHLPFLPHRYSFMTPPFRSSHFWGHKAVNSTTDKSQADSSLSPLGRNPRCPTRWLQKWEAGQDSEALNLLFLQGASHIWVDSHLTPTASVCAELQKTIDDKFSSDFKNKQETIFSVQKWLYVDIKLVSS